MVTKKKKVAVPGVVGQRLREAWSNRVWTCNGTPGNCSGRCKAHTISRPRWCVRDGQAADWEAVDE